MSNPTRFYNPTESWSKHMDSTELISINKNKDGSFCTVGRLDGGFLSSVTKYNSLGEEQWKSILGKEKAVFVTSITEAENNQNYISGLMGASSVRTGSITVGYAALLDSNGSIVWQKDARVDAKDAYVSTYDVPYVRSLSGDYVVMAGFFLPYPAKNDMKLIFRRISENSTEINEVILDTISNVEGIKIISLSETIDHGYIAFVQPKFSNRPKEFQLWKLSQEGMVEWKKSWVEESLGYIGGAAIQTSQGGYAVVNSTSCLQSDTGFAHFRLFSRDGTILYHTWFSAKKMTIVNSIVELSNKEFIVGGATLDMKATSLNIPTESRDNYLAKLSIAGDVLWQNIWGQENRWEEIKSLIEEDDGSFIVAGAESEYGAFIAKLRPTTSSVAELGTQQDIASMVITESQEGAYRAEYTLSQPTTVTLKVYSSMGNEVASIIAGSKQDMGVHTCLLPTDNLSSGMYYVRLSIGNQILAKPIVIIR